MLRTSSSRSQTFRIQIELAEDAPWPAGNWTLALFSNGSEWERYLFSLPLPTAFPQYPNIPTLGHAGDDLAIFLPTQLGTSTLRISPGSVSENTPGGKIYRFPNAIETVSIDRSTALSMPNLSIPSATGTGPLITGTVRTESEIAFKMNPAPLSQPELQITRADGGSHLDLLLLDTTVAGHHVLRESSAPGLTWSSREIIL